jgi:hypothetical protein
MSISFARVYAGQETKAVSFKIGYGKTILPGIRATGMIMVE